MECRSQWNTQLITKEERQKYIDVCNGFIFTNCLDNQKNKISIHIIYIITIYAYLCEPFKIKLLQKINTNIYKKNVKITNDEYLRQDNENMKLVRKIRFLMSKIKIWPIDFINELTKPDVIRYFYKIIIKTQSNELAFDITWFISRLEKQYNGKESKLMLQDEEFPHTLYRILESKWKGYQNIEVNVWKCFYYILGYPQSFASTQTKLLNLNIDYILLVQIHRFYKQRRPCINLMYIISTILKRIIPNTNVIHDPSIQTDIIDNLSFVRTLRWICSFLGSKLYVLEQYINNLNINEQKRYKDLLLIYSKSIPSININLISAMHDLLLMFKGPILGEMEEYCLLNVLSNGGNLLSVGLIGHIIQFINAHPQNYKMRVKLSKILSHLSELNTSKTNELITTCIENHNLITIITTKNKNLINEEYYHYMKLFKNIYKFLPHLLPHNIMDCQLLNYVFKSFDLDLDLQYKFQSFAICHKMLLLSISRKTKVKQILTYNNGKLLTEIQKNFNKCHDHQNQNGLYQIIVLLLVIIKIYDQHSLAFSKEEANHNNTRILQQMGLILKTEQQENYLLNLDAIKHFKDLKESLYN